MLKAGVLGHPVSHSLSPEIFKFVGERLGRKIQYRKYDLRPNHFDCGVRSLKKDGLVGWNVTLPYKEEILRKLDRISPEAKSVGAINVVRRKGKELCGFNTDVFGIKSALKEKGFKAKGKKIVVIGAGGAAKAAGYALGELGAGEVLLANRTPQKARRICRNLFARFPKTKYCLTPWSIELPSADLYIHATPMGMKGFPKYTPVFNGRRRAMAFDLVYQPENTAFLLKAEAQNLRCMGGLDMLIWQALASWELWFGKIRQRQKIKDELKRHLRKHFL